MQKGPSETDSHFTNPARRFSSLELSRIAKTVYHYCPTGSEEHYLETSTENVFPHFFSEDRDKRCLGKIMFNSFFVYLNTWGWVKIEI